jgi:Transcriptional antiterminator
MIITAREQKLIDAFLRENILTIDEMLLVTQTSKRTLYRDLQSLQTSLSEVGINLLKTDAGYILRGNLSSLKNLESLEEWRADDRMFAEMLLLLSSEMNLSQLMSIFSASQPTISHDLNLIEEELMNNQASLKRDKGLRIEASEEVRRSILVGILAKIIKPIEFFNLDEESYAKNSVLKIIPYEKLELVNKTFAQVNISGFSDKNQFIWRAFFLASILSKGQIKFTGDKSSHDSYELTKEIASNLGEFLSDDDIAYLSEIADVLHFEKGSNLLLNENFNAIFSYKISRFISEMGNRLNIDFERDEKLFDLLSSHLRSTILLPSFFEMGDLSMLAEIESKNQQLFNTVSVLLEEILKKDLTFCLMKTLMLFSLIKLVVLSVRWVIV